MKPPTKPETRATLVPESPLGCEEIGLVDRGAALEEDVDGENVNGEDVVAARDVVEREEDVEGKVDVKDGATVGGRIDDTEVGDEVLHESSVHVGVGADVDGAGDEEPPHTQEPSDGRGIFKP